MLIKLEQYRAHNIVKQVAKDCKLKSNSNCLERDVEFELPLGTGKMVSFKLSDGISFLMFDGLLEEDMVIKMPADLQQPLIFSYILNGALTHSFDNGHSTYRLESLQSSITTNIYKTNQEFIITSKEEQSIIIVMIDRVEYLKKVGCYIEQMPSKMQDLFNDSNSQNKFLYEAPYSFRIGDIVNEIKKDLNKDVVRSTFIESKILELFSYSIKQFREDASGSKKQVQLRQSDVAKIEEAKIILEKELFAPPTIKDLSQMVGVNQNKLKFGFKEMYDSTIKTYVINQRLELARVAILTDTKSMKQVAESIGYSNYSHFSRLFKRKYGMLPKDYALHTTQRVQLSIDKLEE